MDSSKLRGASSSSKVLMSSDAAATETFTFKFKQLSATLNSVDTSPLQSFENETHRPRSASPELRPVKSILSTSSGVRQPSRSTRRISWSEDRQDVSDAICDADSSPRLSGHKISWRGKSTYTKSAQDSAVQPAKAVIAEVWQWGGDNFTCALHAQDEQEDAPIASEAATPTGLTAWFLDGDIPTPASPTPDPHASPTENSHTNQADDYISLQSQSGAAGTWTRLFQSSKVQVRCTPDSDASDLDGNSPKVVMLARFDPDECFKLRLRLHPFLHHCQSHHVEAQASLDDHAAIEAALQEKLEQASNRRQELAHAAAELRPLAVISATEKATAADDADRQAQLSALELEAQALDDEVKKLQTEAGEEEASALADPRQLEGSSAMSLESKDGGQLLWENNLVQIWSSWMPVHLDTDGCWRTEVALHSICRTEGDKQEAMTVTSSTETGEGASQGVRWEANSRALASLRQDGCHKITRSLRVTLIGFQSTALGATPLPPLEPQPMPKIRMRSGITRKAQVRSPVRSPGRRHLPPTPQDAAEVPFARLDCEVVLPVDIITFLQAMPIARAQACWDHARYSRLAVDLEPRTAEALRWIGRKQLMEAVSFDGQFQFLQGTLQPPPPRCASGASAQLLAAVLPEEVGGKPYCKGCCFLALTGGGGAAVTISIFSADRGLCAACVAAVAHRLETHTVQQLIHEFQA
eukprot:TRINITY_DN65094_c0_g1_i1.p1 TRINITY_DN65094_c0_g1~~TRINITY_DN65094_c0_g1_i1.p1  ORF type:complete len:736 (-),score=148.34 TRINITY_DN65094_c0_g1_i1:50-2143(-)